MGLFDLFKKKKENPEHILKNVHKNRGLIWANIRMFKESLLEIDNCVVAGTKEMNEMFPVKHHLEDGLYTREVFMPKDSLVVSFIHKQNHPSFFLSGEMSVLFDTGEVKKFKAPMKVMTEIGTQRVAYMHEDCVWVCVYKTDKKTIEEAEKDVYTEDYNELPPHIILNKGLIWQE
tara:strand:+ start:4336 stop:4860 length:525 start_codon:yes stop_codon:yes gene_type:complete